MASAAAVLAVLGLLGCAVLGWATFQANKSLDRLRADQSVLGAQLEQVRSQAQSDRENATQQLAALKAELGQQVAEIGSKVNDQAKQLAQVIASAPPNWRAVAQSVAASVVLVKCGDSTGSGFSVNLGKLPVGYKSGILTNAHVVQGCGVGTDEVSYVRNSKTTTAVLANLDYRPDDNRDIALLLSTEAIPALSAGPPPQQGDAVATMGFPLGLPSNFTTGVVSHVYEDGWIQTNAPISAGNSGGPLMDDKGRVLGITTWSIVYTPEAEPRPTQNLNFAEPLSNACGFVAGTCPFAS